MLLLIIYRPIHALLEKFHRETANSNFVKGILENNLYCDWFIPISTVTQSMVIYLEGCQQPWMIHH